MSWMTALDSSAGDKDRDVVTIIKDTFGQSLHLSLVGEVCRVNRSLPAESFNLCLRLKI
jgi:hypothetical protein